MKKVIVGFCAVIGISLFTLSCSKDDNSKSSSGRNIQQEENNKQLVLTFYQKLFGDKDLSAIDNYIGAVYIQHNPQVADGKDAFKAMASQWLAGGPKTTVDIRRSVAEGDIVVLHVRNPTSDGKFTAVAEFFRLENNKIVEHWDVTQAAPDTSANSHPMF